MKQMPTGFPKNFLWGGAIAATRQKVLMMKVEKDFV